MPVSSLAMDVPALLRRYGLRPNKRLGQNFLVDPSALQRVVEAAEIKASDAVLEIGAGLGSLTRLLAERASKVVAVELDQGLIPALSETLVSCPNAKVIHGDILALNPDALMDKSGYLVVANIPYYITSALIRHLLEASLAPRRLVLTVQREVGERICAAPGEMSLLALSVQVYGLPRQITRIPAGAFYPAPKVDSMVVRVDLHAQPRVPPALTEDFFRLAKAGFSQKRKTLRNALSGGMHWSPEKARDILQAARIEPQRRAETLAVEEWVRLAEQVQALPPDR